MENFVMAHPFITLFIAWSLFGAIKVVIRGWPPQSDDDE